MLTGKLDDFLASKELLEHVRDLQFSLNYESQRRKVRNLQMLSLTYKYVLILHETSNFL